MVIDVRSAERASVPAPTSVRVRAPFDIPFYGKPHWRAVACFLSDTATLESVEELDIAMLSLSVLSDGPLKESRESRVDRM
jgi:hypothetical protein